MRHGPSPGGPPGGGGFAGPTEGAPLVSLPATDRKRLLGWTAIGGAALVLDAVPATDGAAGRAHVGVQPQLVIPASHLP